MLMDENREARLWVVWAILLASFFQGLTPDPDDLASSVLLRVAGSLCVSQLPDGLPPSDQDEPADVPVETTAAPIGSGWFEFCQASLDHSGTGIETFASVLDPCSHHLTFSHRLDSARPERDHSLCFAG